MDLKITVLGCGGSSGVPAIGNNWGTCDSANPKNIRTRPALSVQSNDATIIIDTGADFRDQLNRENIEKIDAVIYTHAHGDHVGGIDDLRSLHRRYKKTIPIYSNQVTITELQERFVYMFTHTSNGLYPKVCEPHVWTEEHLNQEQSIQGIKFIPFEQDHLTCQTLGFRFGNLAYSTDMVNLDTRAINILKGIDTWIVDGGGYYFTAEVHATIERVIELNEKVGAQNIYLTHLSLMMDYEEMISRIPKGYLPCYDGMQFTTKQD